MATMPPFNLVGLSGIVATTSIGIISLFLDNDSLIYYLLSDHILFVFVIIRLTLFLI